MASTFKRDRYFWAPALQTVCVNIFLGSFGPSQPLLRADQGTSLTIAGLHGTALGLASILAGLANPHLAHRFGRAITGWIGLTIFSIGLMAFVASPSVLFSMFLQQSHLTPHPRHRVYHQEFFLVFLLGLQMLLR